MFNASRPVWAAGRSTELNLHLEFLIDLPAGSETVRMTASTAYQLFIDGECIAYGPARAGDGHFRVDEWCVRGAKSLRALVAGYYTSCFQYALHPSFLNLEVLDAAGNALLATGRDEILCREYAPRLRFTDKYSRQRLYTEVYDFCRPAGAVQTLEVLPDPIYLPRGVKPFSNAIHDFTGTLTDFDAVCGQFVSPNPARELGDLSPMHNVDYLAPGHSNRFDSFECSLYHEINSISYSNPRPAGPGPLRAGTARIYVFDADRAGQIGLICTASEDAELYIAFDEMLLEDDVDPNRFDTASAVKLTLPAGEHKFLTFEPYTFKYLKMTVTKGCVDVRRLYLLEQAGEETRRMTFADPRLQRIYDAAANTFRQNATDIFMDCPSRERAGWSCDSFFTARAEHMLTGGCRVETNFLENFARCTGFRITPTAPKGVVPMIHPGDTDYIPEYIMNWNLWLILEIEEYVRDRGGDPKLAEALKPIARGILGAMEALENEFGLIEDMPGWVFVEWSRANDKDVVCGVNFPTNMLYCGAMEAAGRTYGDAALIEKAAKLRETIRAMAFNGTYFVDNAIRRDGKLVQTATTTEVCQIYAFFFDVATEELHPGLWDTFIHKFGPHRRENNLCPDVPFANAFIGNYLRLDVLMRKGLYQQLLDEIVGFFDIMAVTTGSLWEHVTPTASCCHGFASHVVVWLEKIYDALKLGG